MRFRITSEYGQWEQFREQPHTGIDIGMDIGTPLQSIGNAIVERVVDYGNYNIGKGVILQLPDGKRVIYGHMSEVIVDPGQKLSAGQLIGYSGNSGHSTGPHLHFAVKEGYTPIDPTPYLEYLEKPMHYVYKYSKTDMSNSYVDGFMEGLKTLHDSMDKTGFVDYLDTVQCIVGGIL